MAKKYGDKRIVSYRGHVIWLSCDGYFKVALKRNGTDDLFNDIYEAYAAIDKAEDLDPVDYTS